MSARSLVAGRTDPVPESPTPLRRIEDGFRGRDGTELFRRAWLPIEPRLTMVLVHGFGEHSGRYERFARWFALRGVAVHAYDQRGHGRTPGPRGHVERFACLLDDLDSFLELIGQSDAGRPPVLVGHSLGGLIATASVCERQPAIDRLAVSAPALAIAPDVSPLRLRLARILRSVWPGFSMQSGLDVDRLSKDPDVVRRYVEDPLVHGTLSAAFAAGVLDAQVTALASAGKVHVPMLLLHGESDALCPATCSRTFYDALPTDRVSGSAIKTYPSLKHEIFNEPEAEQVYSDLLAWLDAPPGEWTG